MYMLCSDHQQSEFMVIGVHGVEVTDDKLNGSSSGCIGVGGGTSRSEVDGSSKEVCVNF